MCIRDRITRIQDEAHRFAIEYHRKLRGQGQVHSVLDDIPGIGPARRKDLMRRFPGLEAIRNADVETLKELPSICLLYTSRQIRCTCIELFDKAGQDLALGLLSCQSQEEVISADQSAITHKEYLHDCILQILRH